MKPTVRRLVRVALLTALGPVALSAPAGAQQLVDAGRQDNGSGGLAFVLMAIMVIGIWGALFSMDRVRRRREQPSPE